MNYNLELSIEEINNVLAGLRELPFKVAQPLIDKIVEQAQAQINAEQSISKPVEEPSGAE